MAKIAPEIRAIINRLINEINKNKITISEAFLFGSYANNTQKAWSDIDIALVSESFEGCRFTDTEKIRDIYLNIDLRLSPYPLNPEQLKDSWFVHYEIIKNGIKVC